LGVRKGDYTFGCSLISIIRKGFAEPPTGKTTSGEEYSGINENRAEYLTMFFCVGKAASRTHLRLLMRVKKKKEGKRGVSWENNALGATRNVL